MKIILSILAALLIWICPCPANAQSGSITQFKQLGWLAGKWQRTNAKPGQSGFEYWDRVSAVKLVGKGLTLKGRDTVFVEGLEISNQGKDILYTVKLSDEKMPVVFKLTRITRHGFTFENPAHDFPKKIEYSRSGKTATAVVSGGDRKIVYEFSGTGS